MILFSANNYDLNGDKQKENNVSVDGTWQNTKELNMTVLRMEFAFAPVSFKSLIPQNLRTKRIAI